MQSDLKVINYERILGTLAQGLHNPTKITAMLENVVKVKNEEEAAALFDEPTPPEKHPKEDIGNVHYIHSKRPEKSS